MDAVVSFGRWLEKRRKSLDLTREELAQQVGCSVSALRKIESDERRPSKQLAELLARALSIPENEQPAFLRIVRGELPPDKLQSPLPLPNLDLLQSPASFSKHIPIPSTSLIGRETELAALRQMLADPQCRLITLVGPGGSGKTRLAIEAARNLGIAFRHGVVFVPFAGLDSTNLIIPAIINALGLKFDGSGEPYEQLLTYLKGKQIFLILDNLEHLLDGIAIVSKIIENSPQAKVLSTSREQLNLHGEWVFEVRGLSLPQSVEDMEFDSNSAVTLFLERARQVKATTNLKDEDRAAILRICKLVEGMPLAIELSAVWTRTLSFQEIAREIAKSMDFLSTNMRDIPERHRSLRAVFDHSWRRLTKVERDVLMKLSVFQGGFTRDSAKQVANANLAVLNALIMKSLIHRTGEERYDLHEAVRHYGLIQLEQSEIGEQTRSAHLQSFIHLAETIEPELTQSEQDRWLAYLETEHDNIRAALHWAFNSGDIQSSLRLTGALWHFWHLHSHFAEGSRWLERALQTAGPEVPAALRAKALYGAGSLAYYQSHFDQSIRWLEECLAMKSYLNEHDIAYAQALLAMVIQEQSDFARAWDLYEQAIQRFRRLNDEYGILRTLNNQGTLAYDMADFETADRLFGEVLILARKRNDKDTAATALINLGWAAAIRGDDTASNLCREGLALVRDLGSKLHIAFCLEGIAAGIALRGQPDRAVRLFGAANALRRSISALPGRVNARYLETMLQPARDSLSEAAFVSAWGEGEAMSLGQAIELALTV